METFDWKAYNDNYKRDNDTQVDSKGYTQPEATIFKGNGGAGHAATPDTAETTLNSEETRLLKK